MAEFEVPQPIICSPFAEPSRHWLIHEGAEPALVDGRRHAHYFYRPPGQETGAADGAPVGERIDLALVNLIRERVGHWRAEGYPGVTGTTLELLEYWRRDGRENVPAESSFIILHSSFLFFARFAAKLTASSRLPGSATPLPAMS